MLTLFSVVLYRFMLPGLVKADWWDRPDSRPSQPAEHRSLPTLPPEPTLTSAPTVTQPITQPTGSTAPSATVAPTGSIHPSPTVTSQPVGGLPTSIPTPTNVVSGGTSNDDPCAPGKSYTGPYCGWAPGVESGQGNVQLAQSVGGVEGQRVLGLSKTSSGDLELSDIIFLTGILCLLLYARSKLIINQQSH